MNLIRIKKINLLLSIIISNVNSKYVLILLLIILCSVRNHLTGSRKMNNKDINTYYLFMNTLQSVTFVLDR